MKVYKIPSSNVSAFEAEMYKLKAKAEKLGCDSSALSCKKVGEELVKETKAIGAFGGGFEMIETGRVLHFTLYEVTGDAPKFDGWEFVAVIEKLDDKTNFVRVLPGQTLPEKYRTEELSCEHCCAIRSRKKYYVVHKADDFKIVGSSCLKDFLGGKSPDSLASAAEHLSGTEVCLREYEKYTFSKSHTDLKKFLGFVSAVIRTHGWVSKAKATDSKPATAYVALTQMFPSAGYENSVMIPTKADKQEALAAIAWAKSLSSKESMTDFEHNIYALASAEHFIDSATGTAAAIVACYRNTLNIVNPTSKYVGSVGEKIEVTVTVTHIHSVEGNWGTTYIHSMRDADGNVFKWFTGSLLDLDATLKLKGTIKAHSEYRGTAETVLTRCKVII